MFTLSSHKRSKSVPSGNDLVRENARLRAQIVLLQARAHELEGLAGEDPLVKLPNRRSFIASLENLIARAARYNEEAAIIFVDVDGLKEINDSCGHVSGDAALVRIAQLIAETVRKSDHVGRLGGDEFGVILEHTNELDGWQMALRIVERVTASKLIVNGRSLQLSVAVGVAAIKPDDDATAVLSRADEQMYRIKKSSRKLTAVNPAKR